MRARNGSRWHGAARWVALAGALGLACGLEPADQNPRSGGNTGKITLPPAGYRLVWSDEFDGASLDASRWTAMAGSRRGAVATPAAVSVANGVATFTTYTQAGTHYTGFLMTEGKFAARYGYWEARVRFRDAPGSWCAFWISAATVDKVGDPVNNGTEIDVVEHRVTDQGNWTELADMVALNVNWDGYGASKQTAQLVTHLPDQSKVQGQWHTYGVLWTASGYIYYVDGMELWRPHAPVSAIAEDIRLTCEVEDASWAGDVPTGGYGPRTASTTGMDVDWVRVYQAP